MKVTSRGRTTRWVASSKHREATTRVRHPLLNIPSVGGPIADDCCRIPCFGSSQALLVDGILFALPTCLGAGFWISADNCGFFLGRLFVVVALDFCNVKRQAFLCFFHCQYVQMQFHAFWQDGSYRQIFDFIIFGKCQDFFSSSGITV